jgi:arylsulfatase A-like enzyme
MTTKAKRLAALCGLFLVAPAIAQQAPPAAAGGSGGGASKSPNIVVIWGDDIGMWNVGAYTHGMMGRTPNIDRIAAQGALFTDHYDQPSCTAGRAAFIAGQMPIRTGMTTIGIPGSNRGIQKEDPTLAEVLKSQGYATAQFGKNHLGDRNEFLPTVHGFDEWFGNPLPLERRGRARGARLSGPEELRLQAETRPARRAAHLGDRH